MGERRAQLKARIPPAGSTRIGRRDARADSRPPSASRTFIGSARSRRSLAASAAQPQSQRRDVSSCLGHAGRDQPRARLLVIPRDHPVVHRRSTTSGEPEIVIARRRQPLERTAPVVRDVAGRAASETAADRASPWAAAHAALSSARASRSSAIVPRRVPFAPTRPRPDRRRERIAPEREPARALSRNRRYGKPPQPLAAARRIGRRRQFVDAGDAARRATRVRRAAALDAASATRARRLLAA